MAQDYQQTNDSLGFGINVVQLLVGGTAGTRSASVTVDSAGAGLQNFAVFGTNVGDPDTASITGALTIRWRISTANSNVTWSTLEWSDSCQGTDESLMTTTSALAISLGTTGAKTASCTLATTHLVGHSTCSPGVSAREVLRVYGTSGATMKGVIIFVPDQIVTFPFTSGSGAAAPASVFNLASTKAGK